MSVETKERVVRAGGKALIGFVYLSHSEMDQDYDKVGFTTRSVERRRQELSTGCKTKPHRMLAWVPSMNAREDEKEVHQAFIDFRFKPTIGQEKANEFFSVSQRGNIVIYFRDVLYPRFVRDFKAFLMGMSVQQCRLLELNCVDLEIEQSSDSCEENISVETSRSELVLFQDLFEIDMCGEDAGLFCGSIPCNYGDAYYVTAKKLLTFHKGKQSKLSSVPKCKMGKVHSRQSSGKLPHSHKSLRKEKRKESRSIPFPIKELYFSRNEKIVRIRYFVTTCTKCFVVGADIAKLSYGDGTGSRKQMTRALRNMGVDMCLYLTDELDSNVLLTEKAYKAGLYGSLGTELIVISLEYLEEFLHKFTGGNSIKNRGFITDIVHNLKQHLAISYHSKPLSLLVLAMAMLLVMDMFFG